MQCGKDGARMAQDPDGGRPLDRLGERIAAAKEARSPKRGKGSEKYTVGSIAWRMVTELVVGVLVGGAMGWGLDSLFGTLPIFLIVMGLLGFAAGVRTMMRSADEIARHGQGGNGGESGSGDGPRS